MTCIRDYHLSNGLVCSTMMTASKVVSSKLDTTALCPQITPALYVDRQVRDQRWVDDISRSAMYHFI